MSGPNFDSTKGKYVLARCGWTTFPSLSWPLWKRGAHGRDLAKIHRLYLIIKHAALSWGPSSICSIIGWADSETENNTRKLSHFGLVYTRRAWASWRPAPQCGLRLRPCISNSGLRGAGSGIERISSPRHHPQATL